MLHKKIVLALALLSAVISAGCAGTHGGLPTGETTQLTFSGEAAYNGSTLKLNAGNATTVEMGGVTIVTSTSVNRSLKIIVPTTTVMAGDTFTLGAGGASAVYTETKDRDTVVYSWVANSGTLTFTTDADGAIVATVDIDGAHFVVDGTVEGNPATGSFTLTGFVGGVPIDVHGGTGGTTELIFSSVSGASIVSTAITDGTVTYTASATLGNTLVATEGTGASTRKFTFYSGPATPVGTDFDLTGFGNNNGYCTYEQGDGSLKWVATGGKMKILERSSTTMTVQLTNATFVSGGAGTSGTFTVNGVVSRTDE